MITCGRLDLMRRSVACFKAQTYPKKDLVILSQGTPSVNSQIRREFAGPSISFHEAPRDLSLGAMRNTSIDLSTGDIFCQWDDDDLSHPNRLLTQYRSLVSNDRHIASMYTNFLKYYENSGELYWCDWSGEKLPQGSFICNTLMSYRKNGLSYPEVGAQSCVEEDLNMLGQLLRKGEVGKVIDGWQFVYVYHGGNVYSLKHHNYTLNTSSGKSVYDVERLMQGRKLIESTLDASGIDSVVRVRGLEEEAFIWLPERNS